MEEELYLRSKLIMRNNLTACKKMKKVEQQKLNLLINILQIIEAKRKSYGAIHSLHDVCMRTLECSNSLSG